MNRKWLWMLILSPIIFMGAAENPKIVTVPSETPLLAPAATPIPDAKVTEFLIEGPDAIQEGKLLKLHIKGIESKIDPETGLKTPGVRWGVYPASDDMEITPDGFGLNFCAQTDGYNPVSYWFVAAVNNTDPLKAPQMFMKLVTILPRPLPPNPNPGPSPTPTPDNSVVPDDEFDNVGKLTNSVVANFPLRKETAAIYRDCANKLESGEYPTINTATAYCQAQRKQLWGTSSQWPTFEAKISPVWNKFWANPSKQMVIKFYRAVAKGLDPSGT